MDTTHNFSCRQAGAFTEVVQAGNQLAGITDVLPDPGIIMNSSGALGPSLSHQSGGFRRDRVRWPASLGVSEIADMRHSLKIAGRHAE
ncbi:hypothetical protein [Streptomyces sp. NPDC005538]|uniref:hypothetical protein n=1 Tax=Streptomyces sp. NPDC005538 TaxID=3157043 RepID=UPI0033A8701D